VPNQQIYEENEPKIENSSNIPRPSPKFYNVNAKELNKTKIFLK
jgi:hypothetical protein